MAKLTKVEVDQDHSATGEGEEERGAQNSQEQIIALKESCLYQECFSLSSAHVQGSEGWQESEEAPYRPGISGTVPPPKTGMSN